MEIKKFSDLFTDNIHFQVKESIPCLIIKEQSMPRLGCFSGLQKVPAKNTSDEVELRRCISLNFEVEIDNNNWHTVNSVLQ